MRLVFPSLPEHSKGGVVGRFRDRCQGDKLACTQVVKSTLHVQAEDDHTRTQQVCNALIRFRGSDRMDSDISCATEGVLATMQA